MKSLKVTTAQEYALMSQFEDACRSLAETQAEAELARPLSYWALPCDRRLPYALLDRSVGAIVRTPFVDLSSTPGIGPKKINSLIMLLKRALEGPPQAPHSAQNGPCDVAPPAAADGEFDPRAVSEALWEEWRHTVHRHQLQQEKLGRLAPSLRDLPTVIWHARLEQYLPLNLADLRRLKTHGEKRVATVLEVFLTIHQLLGSAGAHHRLAISLDPTFVGPLQHWIGGELANSRSPSVEEVRQNLVLPLLNQIQLDAGDVVHGLATGRLGIESESESVREQSRRLGVTRARVYQLLDTCAEIMEVRWPDGRWQLAALAEKFAGVDEHHDGLRLFESTRSLLFPQRLDQPLAEAVPA